MKGDGVYSSPSAEVSCTCEALLLLLLLLPVSDAAAAAVVDAVEEEEEEEDDDDDDDEEDGTISENKPATPCDAYIAPFTSQRLR